MVKVRAGTSRPRLLLWSEADVSGSALMGYGLVLSCSEWTRPIAAAGRIPKRVATQFNEHAIQIGVVEILAAVSAPFTLPDVFEGRDLLHFVDNQNVQSCLVNGCSRADDMGLSPRCTNC